MEIDMNIIGDRIKERRKELKLSQIDIYRECNITSGALSKIENGKTIPSIIAFYKLTQVLMCDINWLITGCSSDMKNMQEEKEQTKEMEKIITRYKDATPAIKQAVRKLLDIENENNEGKSLISKVG